MRDDRWSHVAQASWGPRLLRRHALKRDNPAPNTWLRRYACRLPITGRYGMAPSAVNHGSTACGKTTTARLREWAEGAYDGRRVDNQKRRESYCARSPVASACRAG